MISDLSYCWGKVAYKQLPRSLAGRSTIILEINLADVGRDRGNNNLVSETLNQFM